MKQPTTAEATIVNVFITRTLGVWSIVSGLLMVLSGISRWQSSAYDILNLMPGSPYTWAAFAIIAGVLTIIGSCFYRETSIGNFHLRNVGLWLVALWCFIFVIAFIGAAVVNPTISFNISSTYFFLGVLAIFLTHSRFTP